MIKINRDDISYLIRNEGNKNIVTMIDDNQFCLFQIEIDKNIGFKFITPLADNDKNLNLTILENNLFTPLLDSLFEHGEYVYDSFNQEKNFKICKDQNQYIITVSKESCPLNEIFYCVNKNPKKENTAYIEEQIELLKDNIKNLSMDSNYEITTNHSLTKTLYRQIG